TCSSYLPLCSTTRRPPSSTLFPYTTLFRSLEQAELIAFGVGQDVPRLLPRLADVGRAGTEPQKTFELVVLVTVGGVDVDVQPRLRPLRFLLGAENDRRLRTTEPLAWPDLHRAVVHPIEHDEVQGLAPESRQSLGVLAVEYQLTDATCHERNLPSTRKVPERAHTAPRPEMTIS